MIRARSNLSVLHVTAMWPTPEHPGRGTFVKNLVDALSDDSISNDVMVVPAHESRASYIKSLPALVKRCQGRRYDLIHAQYAHTIIMASLQRHIPVIGHYHGEYDDPKDALLADIASRCVSFGIAVDKKGYRRIRCKYKELIPIGIRSCLFSPLPMTACRRTLGLDPKLRYVLFPGDPAVREKNYPLFLTTAQLIRQQAPDVRAIVLRGIAYEKVPFYMNAANVLLMTSTTEASPTVIKEALLCNLPIVSTNVGDVQELLSDVRNCAIEKHDPIALARATIRILRSGGRTDGLKKQAIVDIRTTVRRVISFYEQVLTVCRDRNRAS